MSFGLIVFEVTSLLVYLSFGLLVFRGYLSLGLPVIGSYRSSGYLSLGLPSLGVTIFRVICLPITCLLGLIPVSAVFRHI